MNVTNHLYLVFICIFFSIQIAAPAVLSFTVCMMKSGIVNFFFHLFILLVKNNVFFSFCQREQLTWSQTNILLNVIYLIICSNCIVHKVLYVVLIVTFFTHYIIFIIHTPLMKVKIVKCLCTDLFIILQKI